MSFLLLENRLSIDTLVVPGYFIDRFLPAASGTDVKVYLYLLRAFSIETPGLSSASIGAGLDISEREVLRSLSYWESVGLLRLSFTSGHELSGIAFTDPPQAQTASVSGTNSMQTQTTGVTSTASMQSQTTGGTGTASMQSQAAQSVAQAASARMSNTASVNMTQQPQGFATSQPQTHSGAQATSQPQTLAGAQVAASQTTAPTAASTNPSVAGLESLHLSQEEQILLENDPEFNMYMSAWSQYFSRPLSYNDTESFGYWYLQFNRSTDAIDYLVDYCANHCKGPLNMKFIDSVAQSWHQKGLHTIEDIREYNQLHNDTVYAVMKAYGLYNQTAAPAQLEYINRWIKEYNFPTDVYVYACNITMQKCQRPNKNFTESILKRWKEKNVRTLADAQAAEALREQTNKANASSAKRTTSSRTTAPASKGTQQFRNFTERTNNNYMEKILKQYSQKPNN